MAAYDVRAQTLARLRWFKRRARVTNNHSSVSAS